MTTPARPTKAFWIISIVLLIWNLFGVITYIAHVTMTPEMLAALPDEQRALYTNTPVWATAAFAVAVWFSVLGCVLLVLRKKLATPVFIIAFAGIIVQMIHSLFISNSIEVYGPGGMIMPIMVVVLGAYLIWFSRSSAAKGWLN